MTVNVELAIQDPSWTVLGDLQSLAERAVAAAIAEAGVVPDAGSELSCLFCDDATIRALNAQWRGQDKATNVLSFPAAGAGAEAMLGDIAMAFETVMREAGAEAKPPQDHAAHLLIHGTLHLVGHDHEVDSDAAAMEAIEVRAMARLGLPDPYGGSLGDAETPARSDAP